MTEKGQKLIDEHKLREKRKEEINALALKLLEQCQSECVTVRELDDLVEVLKMYASKTPIVFFATTP